MPRAQACLDCCARLSSSTSTFSSSEFFSRLAFITHNRLPLEDHSVELQTNPLRAECPGPRRAWIAAHGCLQVHPPFRQASFSVVWPSSPTTASPLKTIASSCKLTLLGPNAPGPGVLGLLRTAVFKYIHLFVKRVFQSSGLHHPQPPPP